MTLSGTEIEAESFRVETRAFDRGLVIVLAGEFDLAGVPRFERAWAEVAAAKPDRVMIDCFELQFIDSSGISGVVTAMAHEEQAGRHLQVAGVRDQVERIFELVGLLDRLELVERPQATSPWPPDPAA